MITIQILVYPILFTLLASFMLLTIPRATLRRLMPYGIVLGGMLSFITFFFLGTIFKVLQFEEFGLLHIHGHPALALLAWTFIVVFFLYFWPKDNKWLEYLYCFAWSLLATGFSQILKNCQVITYSTWFYPIPMLFLFLVKFSFIAWCAQPWNLE